MKTEDEKALIEEDEDQMVPKPKRKIIVEPLLILYSLAGFPMEQIIQQLMYLKVAEHIGIPLANGSSVPDTYCAKEKGNFTGDYDVNATDLIQEAAATWSMYISLVSFLPTLLALMFYGTYSDKLGRKVTFVMPCIGSIVQSLVYMAIIHFDLPIYYFFLVVLSVVFGDMFTLLIGAYAYIADTNTPEQLAFRMIFLDVMIFLFGGLINLATGYFIKVFGLFWPFLFIIGGKLLTILYAVFFIPETVSKVKSSGVKKRYTIRDIFNGIKLYIKDNGSNRRWKLLMISSVYFIHDLFSTMSVYTLFTKNVPLCWGPILSSWFGTILMLSAAIGSVAGALLTKFGIIPEVWLALIGKVSSCLSYFYTAIVQTTVMMFFVPLIGILQLVTIPILRAMLSRLVKKDEQGSLMGALSILAMMCYLVSDVSVNPVYKNTLRFMPGFVFLVAGAVNCITVIILGTYIYLIRRENKETNTKSIDTKQHTNRQIQEENPDII